MSKFGSDDPQMWDVAVFNGTSVEFFQADGRPSFQDHWVLFIKQYGPAKVITSAFAQSRVVGVERVDGDE